MRSFAGLCAIATAGLLLAACHPPEVVQGTVVRVDTAGQIVVLRDDLPPNDEREYSVADASLNVPPAAGDVVRIAYHQVGDRRVATRVMNISRGAASEPTGGAH